MTTEPRLEAMRIVTGCSTIEEFVAVFHRFCDSKTCFIPTVELRPVGSELGFSLRLADGTPMLRGTCVVKDAWSTFENRFNRPGIHVVIRRLTTESELVFEQLLAHRASVTPPREPKPASVPGELDVGPTAPTTVASESMLLPVASAGAPAAAAPRVSIGTTAPPTSAAAATHAPSATITTPPSGPPPSATDATHGSRGTTATPPAAAAAPRAPKGANTQPSATRESRSVASRSARKAKPPPLPSAARRPPPSERAARSSPLQREVLPPAVAPGGTRPPSSRTPEPRLVLPANPLTDFDDDTLRAFIDATVAEEPDAVAAIAAHAERSSRTQVGVAPTKTRRPSRPPSQPRRATQPVPVIIRDEPTHPVAK